MNTRLSMMTFFLGLFFMFSCDTVNNTTTIVSENETSFDIILKNDDIAQSLFDNKTIYGSDCSVSLVEIEGTSALALKTSTEFSDAFIDLESLFGHPIDFSSSRYLSLSLYVPEDSWVSALKLNFKDAEGNFGGIPEITNNFYGHYNQWLDVVVDLQELVPEFQNWHGESNPLTSTTLLSLNPYNAHQADSSYIYISRISLSDEPSKNSSFVRMATKIDTVNIPFKIDFNEGELTRRMMAYRAFESSYQAIAANVAGNDTYAIRMKGNDQNKYIAFLPIMDKVTGSPVDFTKVKRLYFSYYLTEESDDFDGSSLFIATEHWDDILLDTNFYSDYKKGSWQQVSVDINDLNLEQVKGTNAVLPTVYELRLDLNYRNGKKNIEMWIDDFGWE